MDHLQAVKTLAMERYLLEEMSPEERESFEEHYFSCLECAEDARAAASMQDGAASGLARIDAETPRRRRDASEALPFRSPSRGWRSSVALPWAAAATLAVALGYQTLSGPALSRQQQDSVSLTPVTLRPASRGQEAVVSPGPGGIVTLAVDLGGAPFERGIQYEVGRADGKAIASGEAAAPVPGAPLLLMLPGSLLHGSEHYVLTLRSAGATGLTPATYRFSVKAP
jgi:hypothetical protein